MKLISLLDSSFNIISCPPSSQTSTVYAITFFFFEGPSFTPLQNNRHNYSSEFLNRYVFIYTTFGGFVKGSTLSLCVD